jgi:hypothetical protein
VRSKKFHRWQLEGLAIRYGRQIGLALFRTIIELSRIRTRAFLAQYPLFHECSYTTVIFYMSRTFLVCDLLLSLQPSGCHLKSLIVKLHTLAPIDGAVFSILKVADVPTLVIDQAARAPKPRQQQKPAIATLLSVSIVFPFCFCTLLVDLISKLGPAFDSYPFSPSENEQLMHSHRLWQCVSSNLPSFLDTSAETTAVVWKLPSTSGSMLHRGRPTFALIELLA